MSTRCQIGIYEKKAKSILKPDVLLYKHSDGYPEGVLPILLPFLSKFNDRRGIGDAEYCGAWIMYALIDNHVKSHIEWQEEEVKAGRPKFSMIPDDGIDGLGHGICKVFHGDIEYFYRIYPDPPTLEVYEVNMWENKGLEAFKLLETHPIPSLKEGGKQ